MNYRFIQIPREVAPEGYSAAIERMVRKVSACPGVVSIAQVGGVGTPGISDIDFYVVFKDDYAFSANPVDGLSTDDRYLFTHNLFGTSESFAVRMEQYTYFGSYKNLYGKDLLFRNDLETGGVEIMKKQIALEYLLKAWLTITIEKKSGVIKIRNLFLLAKALVHDLSFLNVSSGGLWDTVQEIIRTRNDWFLKPAGAAQLSTLVERYEKELFYLLNDFLPVSFYFPGSKAIPISRNILLKQGEKLNLAASGLMLPAMLRLLLPKAESVQRRLIRFQVEVPTAQSAVPDSIAGRHHWISAACQYNARQLPGFVPTAFGLQIFNSSM